MEVKIKGETWKYRGGDRDRERGRETGAQRTHRQTDRQADKRMRKGAIKVTQPGEAGKRGKSATGDRGLCVGGGGGGGGVLGSS